MSKIALYRKYRPNSFSEIIAQDFIIQTLKNEINNQNTYHAYIFAGARGSGKTSTARIFAKAINCQNPIDGDCCNECDNCLSIINNNCLDIFEIDAASNSGVDEVRKLIDSINYLPTKLNQKVYIIDEAHMLSNSAWNALLKTIEEPPSHVLFIFATTEVQKIPLTIISRCQRFDFYKLTNDLLLELITKITNKENILIANDAKIKLSQLADGSARDCLSILHQLSDFSNSNITLDKLNEVFSLTSTEFKIFLINNWNKSININLVLEGLETKTNNYLTLVQDLINILLDKIIYSKTNNANLLKIIGLSELNQIDLSIDQINTLLNELVIVYEKIKIYGNGLFYLKALFLKVNSCDSDQYMIQSNDEDKELIINQPEIQSATEKNISELDNKKEISIFKTKTLLSHIPTKTHENTIDNKMIFNQIISNENKDLRISLNNALTSFKQTNYTGESRILNLLVKSNKFLVSSNNAAVLLFNFKNEAIEFNKLFWNKSNYQLIKNVLFNTKNLVIIGEEKSTLKEWKSNFIPNEYLDVNLSLLDDYQELTNEEKRKQILDILNE